MARKVYDLASRRVSVTRTPEPVDDPDRGAHPKRSDSAKRSPEPFGEADCESEVRTLKTEYSKLYFDETPFNSAAIRPETYLIIGRRGSGKTALSQYFSFQNVIGNPICIDVDKPTVYREVLGDIGKRASESREIAIPQLMKVWEYVIWHVIFEHIKRDSPDVATVCANGSQRRSVSHLVNDLIESLLAMFRNANGKDMDSGIEGLLSAEALTNAKAATLKISSKKPIIIGLDTLEKYHINEHDLVNAMAALIQFAAEFNRDYADYGIHLKAFVSGEFFPYLKEVVLQNPAKSVKNAVYLLWRPKDLRRLISWRFFRYLEKAELLKRESKANIDWEDDRDVTEKMWRPYFGHEITNARGFREHSFPYVLRHTQMRPRQLILMCNAIAKRALEGRRFPSFTDEDIRYGVKEIESDLASEIISSFEPVYPEVRLIVNALMNIPMLFKGSELDKRAKLTRAQWPQNAYSLANFRQLVTELGIVGRVQRRNDAGWIDAEFDYSLKDRLVITDQDDCAVHPMFYGRFNVECDLPVRVMPFSAENG